MAPKPLRTHLLNRDNLDLTVCNQRREGGLLCTREAHLVTCRRCIVIGLKARPVADAVTAAANRENELTPDQAIRELGNYLAGGRQRGRTDAQTEARGYILGWLEDQVQRHQDQLKKLLLQDAADRPGKDERTHLKAYSAALINAAGAIIDQLKGVGHA